MDLAAKLLTLFIATGMGIGAGIESGLFSTGIMAFAIVIIVSCCMHLTM